MQGYNFDFAMSAQISAKVVEEIIKNTVEQQTGKKVASIRVNTQTVTRGMGITEHDVLLRVRQGLLTEPAVVSADEAGWVVSRLAELMNWPIPRD